jgi:hypothetical protein
MWTTAKPESGVPFGDAVHADGRAHLQAGVQGTRYFDDLIWKSTAWA